MPGVGGSNTQDERACVIYPSTQQPLPRSCYQHLHIGIMIEHETMQTTTTRQLKRHKVKTWQLCPPIACSCDTVKSPKSH